MCLVYECEMNVLLGMIWLFNRCGLCGGFHTAPPVGFTGSDHNIK